MLQELTNSLKVMLYERAVSPLSGVFLGFWTLFNWTALAVFFLGDGDVKSRIAFIEAGYVDILANLYYPLIWSAIFLLVYPFLALGPFALWEKVSGWKVSLKQRFDSTIALSVPQSLALRQEIREKEKQFSEAM